MLNIPQWSLNSANQVFVHGPSERGKSTLLSLINGIQTANDGDVTVLGQCLNTMSNRQRDRFRAENIGYVFQQFNLPLFTLMPLTMYLAVRFSPTKNTTL